MKSKRRRHDGAFKARVAREAVKEEKTIHCLTRSLPFMRRSFDRLIGKGTPVLDKYDRACFEKSRVRILGQPMATLSSPDIRSWNSVLDLILKGSRSRLAQGSMAVS